MKLNSFFALVFLATSSFAFAGTDYKECTDRGCDATVMGMQDGSKTREGGKPGYIYRCITKGSPLGKGERKCLNPKDCPGTTTIDQCHSGGGVSSGSTTCTTGCSTSTNPTSGGTGGSGTSTGGVVP